MPEETATHLPKPAPPVEHREHPEHLPAPTLAYLAQALDAWYARLGRQYGPLSRPQRRVLRLVADRGRVRVGELAERLDVTTAGATRMVDRLEELGYVTRARASAGGDGREVYVALTVSGTAALAAADAAFAVHVQATLAPLTPEECAQLAALLRRIAATDAGADKA
ncbi:MAG: MarR family transcriptional regulator [Ktedonobacterales bacterium]